MKKINKLFCLLGLLVGFFGTTAAQTLDLSALLPDFVLVAAVQNQRYDIVEEFVEKKHANVNVIVPSNGENIPLLQLAALPPYTNARIFTYLAKRPDIKINQKSAYGDTALMAASEFLSVPELQVLFDKKNRNGKSIVKIEATNKLGWTAFLSAAHGGKVENAKFLIHHGANRGAKDRAGNNALIIASQSNQLKMVQYLCNELHFNPAIKNQDGQTAYEVTTDDKVKSFLAGVMKN